MGALRCGACIGDVAHTVGAGFKPALTFSRRCRARLDSGWSHSAEHPGEDRVHMACVLVEVEQGVEGGAV